MTIVISLFNHKGGVSKTTTTFHLGWMLTKLGQKVLIVDADPQCNLTGLALGINDYDALFDFYERKGNCDIYNNLALVFGFESEIKDASKEGIKNPTKTNNPNMSLIAGHVNFAKFELQLATAITSSQSIPLLKPLLGSINNLIRNTAIRGDFDIVLIDMSPNISVTNMCILMASDYFIVPTSPDFFCYQSIESLSNVLPGWHGMLKFFKDGMTLPKNNPKMLGIISQNYRVYKTEKGTDSNEGMTKEFKKWADKIKDITNGKLVKALRQNDLKMVVDESLFKQHVDYDKHDKPYNLANIQDFNSLIPASQTLHKPMFELKQEDLKWAGAVWEREEKGNKIGGKYAIESVNEVYNKLSKAVAGMVGLEIKPNEEIT